MAGISLEQLAKDGYVVQGSFPGVSSLEVLYPDGRKQKETVRSVIVFDVDAQGTTTDVTTAFIPKQ